MCTNCSPVFCWLHHWVLEEGLFLGTGQGGLMLHNLYIQSPARQGRESVVCCCFGPVSASQSHLLISAFRTFLYFPLPNSLPALSLVSFPYPFCQSFPFSVLPLSPVPLLHMQHMERALTARFMLSP